MSLGRRLILITAFAAVAALIILSGSAFTGCEKKATGPAGEKSSAVNVQTSPGQQDQKKETRTPDQASEETAPAATTPSDQTQPTTPGTASEVDAVTKAAIAAARANNPDLPELKVLTAKIIGSWARVDIEPVDKSTDAASVFLKKVDGTWTVFDFGTGIGPEDHPEAPPELFQ